MNALFRLVCTGLIWGQTRFLPSAADTLRGAAPTYLPSYQPWYDPLDTLPYFVSRLGYFKPYLAWAEGLPHYEEPWAILPASQAAYLTEKPPLIWTAAPYTRVRFDQSSRRTQLLSVLHGQKLRSWGGFSLAYQRRTREGEYVGQLTDHWGAALRAFVRKGRWSWESALTWNQLQDQINGGVVYDTAEGPWTAFGKASQPVLLKQTRWRRWKRSLSTTLAFSFTAQAYLYLSAEFLQDHFHPEGADTPPFSPLLADTLPVSWHVTSSLRTLGGGVVHPKGQVALRLFQTTGEADRLLNPWQLQGLEGEAAWQTKLLSVEGTYRRYLHSGAPPPSGSVRGVGQYGPFSVGVRYQSRNLPWLAYQYRGASFPQPNENILEAWGEVALPVQDSLQLPLRVRAWTAKYRAPWRWAGTFYRGPAQQSYGLTLRGGWSFYKGGVVLGLTAQHLVGETRWTSCLPALYGWVQPFFRWKLPGRPPLYELGVRLKGFSPFRPLRYDPLTGLFYPESGLPAQPAFVQADPYLVIQIRRLLIYLRVEQATEGLLSPGYYLTAWYPMPGRAFAFGVQWDLYN